MNKIVDMKGRAIDPEPATRNVSFTEHRDLVIAHNGLVDAHNDLVHKVSLIEKRLDKKTFWKFFLHTFKALYKR